MEYNKYPEALEEILKKNRPKPGEVAIFEILGIKTMTDELGRTRVQMKNSVSVTPTDRIMFTDPSTGEASIIDIAHKPRQVPIRAKDGTTSNAIRFEKIRFTKEGFGQIKVYGSRPDQIGTFDYLFLSNYNVSNKEKPWHVPKSLYSFKLLEPKKSAMEKLKEKRSIAKAIDKVMDLSKEQARDLYIKFGLKGVHPDFGELEEFQLALSSYAEKHPEAILTAKFSGNSELDIFAQGLLDEKVITYTKGKFYYQDEVIAKNNPKKGKPIESLKEYLLSPEGEKFKETVGL
jgi:hypothetical protein